MATQLEDGVTRTTIRESSGPPAIAPDTRAEVVRVTGLSRSFGGKTVLDDVSLTVHAGEFVALLGRSGTGKSTLLRILGDLDDGWTGDVHVDGNTAVVFQDARLLPWATVADNVALGLRSKQATQLAEAVLVEVGLEGRADSWPNTLSGGEAQRAALARALVRAPEVLLLDEPFGALDALTRISMHRLLRTLCERHEPAVVLVTHDVDEAILLADRILVLDDGHVVFDAPVQIDGARRREVPAFSALRRRLLDALGVSDDDDH